MPRVRPRKGGPLTKEMVMWYGVFTAVLLAVGSVALAVEPAPLISCVGPAAAVQAPADRPSIDVVFCIDCSGSMGGVIETAKQKVWEIVNQVAKAKPVPVLRIGLLGYGNGDKTFRSFDLSSDLDEVYKNLMTFKDEGWGDEFVGMAVHKAVGEMQWARGDKSLKVIFVVGNETARQGPSDFDYVKTAGVAKEKGIVVNAIYCGNTDYAAATPTWKEMAQIGTGRYMEIAGGGGAVAIATPFDKELGELSGKLNTTYVAYGREAGAGRSNQLAQDANSTSVGGTVVAAQRATAKSSTLYDNARWDLVDASKRETFKWEDVAEELPEELQKLSTDERKAYVEKKSAERTEIQNKIRDLSAKREAVVREEMAKKNVDTEKAFDENVRKAIVDQAKAKGFEFGG